MLRLAGRLPLRIHYFNSIWLSWLIEKVVKYRVALVDDNLKHAFPEKSEEERLQIRHEFYRHFARIFVEAIWFGACRNARRLRRSGIVNIVNPELLADLYEKSPSVMMMTAHTGNWELFGGVSSYTPGKEGILDEDAFVVVYRELSDKVFDQIMLKNRTAPLKNKNWDGAIETKKILRYIISHRNSKKIYNFITDQKPYLDQYNYPVINFMNRDCRVMTASAEIATRFGMSVVYLRMMEQKAGKYTIELIPICEDASNMDPMDIVREYYRLLEADLRSQPYNYLWTHNRWWGVNNK